jgi:hypothetical protein
MLVYGRVSANAGNYELGNIAAATVAATASTNYADGRVLVSGNEYSSASLGGTNYSNGRELS